MSKPRLSVAHATSRLEAILYHGGWPVRLVRALGLRTSVTTIHHSIAIDRPSVHIPRLRLAYASDFHAGPTTDPAVLLSACAELRVESPDVLLLGGDFVTHVRAEIDWLAPELGDIPAPFGRFAVLGNHDWWSDASYIVERLEAAGIRVLTNRNVQLEPPFNRVWICGVDDHSHGHPNATAALAGPTASASCSCMLLPAYWMWARSTSTWRYAVTLMGGSPRFRRNSDRSPPRCVVPRYARSFSDRSRSYTHCQCGFGVRPATRTIVRPARGHRLRDHCARRDELRRPSADQRAGGGSVP